MAYWLIKSEPSTYSFEKLLKEKQTVWDGVRNYAARIHLRAMKMNELIFFYHSNLGCEIVGIARVTKEAYQDPTTSDDAWIAVDIKAVKKLNIPVSLSTLKTDSRFVSMDLIRLGRLSVQTVKDEEWGMIMKLAGEK